MLQEVIQQDELDDGELVNALNWTLLVCILQVVDGKLK